MREPRKLRKEGEYDANNNMRTLLAGLKYLSCNPYALLLLRNFRRNTTLAGRRNKALQTTMRKY